MEVNVYQVLKCSEVKTTAPKTEGTEKQNYVVAEIVKVNTDEKLAQFKNLIIGSKPFNLVFFEDQGVFYDMVQSKDADGKSDAFIAGNVVIRKTKPYYVIDPATGKPFKYKKEGQMKGLDVVATSVKFFVHADQDIDVEFDKVMRNNASNLVAVNELSVYINHLGLTKQDLENLGIDAPAETEQQKKDADLLLGGEKDPPEPPDPKTGE